MVGQMTPTVTNEAFMGLKRDTLRVLPYLLGFEKFMDKLKGTPKVHHVLSGKE